jgi:hypothetical protein
MSVLITGGALIVALALFAYGLMKDDERRSIQS